MLIDKMSGEKEKWLAAINTTFAHIEGFTILFFCIAVCLVAPISPISRIGWFIFFLNLELPFCGRNKNLSQAANVE
jgi:hypothetical protein